MAQSKRKKKKQPKPAKSKRNRATKPREDLCALMVDGKSVFEKMLTYLADEAVIQLIACDFNYELFLLDHVEARSGLPQPERWGGEGGAH
jgi:hypothetical protein